jgi:hypothetical protein
MRIIRNGCPRCLLCVLLVAVAVVARYPAASAQSVCTAKGYRVLARRWDAVLSMGWELRQSCAHPEWPAHSVVLAAAAPLLGGRELRPAGAASIVQPLLVHAGDPVRLWLQDQAVRIEMSGVAEQSARNGEHLMVRVTRQTDDAGVTAERIPGIVRGAGDVEMER